MIEQLHYISQELPDLSHIDGIEQALISGCKWVQLRVKNEPETVVKELASRAKKLCDEYNAKLIVNDFPLIAKEVGAFGVHLGLLDMPVAQARIIVGDKMIIGGTANTFYDVKLRVKEGADYVGLGPFRFTRTKANLSPVIGLPGYLQILHRLRQSKITIPVIAIGGITYDDIDALMSTGIHGVAISGSIVTSGNKKQLIDDLYSKIREHSIVKA